jgi:hypothetical protein
MDDGRVETKELNDRYRYAKDVKVYSDDGIVPMRRLLWTCNNTRRVNDPMDDGRVEVNALNWRERTINDARLPTDDGISPISLLESRLRDDKAVNDPIVEGTVPLTVLVFRSSATTTPFEHVTPVHGEEHFEATDAQDHPVRPLLPTSVEPMKSHRKPSSRLE